MTHPRAPTVGGLKAINQHLILECHHPDCRHRVRLTAREAVDLLGAATPIPGLNRRLRCAACGARGRDGFVTAYPCTLDEAAARARYQHANGLAQGQPVSWDLDETLATLARLAGGQLGGDGPVE